jgi:hypothetical protein
MRKVGSPMIAKSLSHTTPSDSRQQSVPQREPAFKGAEIPKIDWALQTLSDGWPRRRNSEFLASTQEVVRQIPIHKVGTEQTVKRDTRL